MAYTQEENESFNPPSLTQENYLIGSGDLEGLLDAIANALIQSPFVSTADVENNQKFILNGQLQPGQDSGVLALFQKDVEANVEDNLQSIANQITGEFTVTINEGVDNTISISLSGGGIQNDSLDITDLVVGDGNPLNVSQFISIKTTKSNINPNKAEEFLDTNIFELLPSGDTRQSRIIRLFQELNALLPPIKPEFDSNGDGVVDRNENGNWEGANQYNQDNSISYAQDNQDGNIDEEDAFVHRLRQSSNDTNLSRTIEDIYNTILPYLTDILENPLSPQDDRPEYENQSSGYLKFRNLNQGIVIRNTNQDFVDGLNPNNLSVIDRFDPGISDTEITKGTGFTITMWVKFLDKVSSGTLFNFGNPTRAENPFGFKLETYALNKDDVCREINGVGITFGQYVKEATFAVGPGYDERIFNESDVARFVRLQVREFDDTPDNQFGTDLGLRDSHIGLGGDITFNGSVIGSGRKSTNPGEVGGIGSDENRLLQSTYIPEDFNEWYFICATYNPMVLEDESYSLGDPFRYTPDFWLNHIEKDGNALGDFVANSGYGNKCKVEIISRSDLLRARGFKV